MFEARLFELPKPVLVTPGGVENATSAPLHHRLITPDDGNSAQKYQAFVLNVKPDTYCWKNVPDCEYALFS